MVAGDNATPYETLIHECALRVRVADRGVCRVQLQRILDQFEEGHANVRVIPFDRDGFGGAGSR
ncbi:Scr1 family TA system antitoxin-like transcriptional regulator [Streptomyces ambofaciens]